MYSAAREKFASARNRDHPYPRPKRSLSRKRRHARQFDPCEKLQRRTASRRHVRDLVRHPRRLNRLFGIAAADDAGRARTRAAFRRSTVPLSNGRFSKIPIGPFHTTVFAPAIAFLNASIVFGPISTEIGRA